MKLEELFKTGAVRLPWPTMVNGAIAGASQLAESQTCAQKCNGKRVCATDEVVGEHICEYGLSYFVRNCNDERVTIYAVRGPKNDTKLNKYTKEGLKGRAISKVDLDGWFDSLRLLHEAIEDDFKLRQAEMLDPLHDPIRLAKLISTIAYRLVRQYSDGNEPVEQQILRAPRDLKSLAKSSDLLSDSFDLLSIYFNPEAATYGARHPVNVHGLLTKLVAFFRIDSGDEVSNNRLFLNGECYRNAFVYNSFKLVPFALLTNAVKYGLKGSIEVSVYDRLNGVEVTVSSTGPLIEANELDSIFQKRRRGKWAMHLGSNGRGVGLYLASIIAKAHGFKINVSSNPTGASSKGVPLATNKFWFLLPYQSL